MKDLLAACLRCNRSEEYFAGVIAHFFGNLYPPKKVLTFFQTKVCFGECFTNTKQSSFFIFLIFSKKINKNIL